MCKGDAHGDIERRSIPADSKRFNSALAISSFLGQGNGFLQNLKGVHSCGCGAQLYRNDWAPVHCVQSKDGNF
jgi:hypothetical protein